MLKLKSVTTIIAIISTCTFSYIANAKDGAYVSAFGGYAFSVKSNYSLTYTGTGTIMGHQFIIDTQSSSGTGRIKSFMPFGLAIGYNVQGFSFDLSYTNVSSKIKDSDGAKVRSNIILANTYYNLNNLHPVIKPYAGLGLGLSTGTKLGDYKFKSAIVGRLAVGSKFKIHENVQLFADLGYTVSTKATSSYTANYSDGVAVSVNSKADLKYASVNAGVSYLF